VDAPSARERLEQALDACGAEGLLVELDGSPVEALIDRHDPQRRCVVVAAGGDGTVRSVAQAVAGTEQPFGVLPFGTRNHFARDAGLPLAAEPALAALLDGRETRVDTGAVSSRIFLNNASLGLYPTFVEERRRRSKAWARWPAIAGAAWWVLAQRRRLRVRIDPVGETRASIIFVGNNRYELTGLGVGRRHSLTKGELMLVVATPGRPWGAMRLATRALLGALEQETSYEQRFVDQVRIDRRSERPVLVALDGEPQRLRPPLDFRIRPASVTAPPAKPGASGEPLKAAGRGRCAAP